RVAAVRRRPPRGTATSNAAGRNSGPREEENGPDSGPRKEKTGPAFAGPVHYGITTCITASPDPDAVFRRDPQRVGLGHAKGLVPGIDVAQRREGPDVPRRVRAVHQLLAQ